MQATKSNYSKIKLIYFTDPVCSTCWLIEPYLHRLIQDYKDQLILEIRMGGLLPSWSEFKSPDENVSKEQFLANLINRQACEFGADMDGDIWLENPIKSSYPASIAYHAAKIQDPDKAIKFLRSIREMLFIEKKDISAENVINNAVIRSGLNYEEFSTDLKNGVAEKNFQADLLEKKKWNITRFPTLIFINESDEFIIDKEVFATINEPEILDNWHAIISKLSEGKMEVKIQSVDPIAMMDGFDVLSTREMHIMSGTPIPHLKERLDVYRNNGKLVKEEKGYLDNWRIVDSNFRIQKNNFQFKTASIIGGGISGYAMALCLNRNGVDTHIYERNPDNSTVGFGFLLLKNGIDALNVLGLKSKLLKRGNQINFFKAISPSGEEIYSKSLENCIAISRKNIMELLSEELDSKFVLHNMPFEKLNYSNDGQVDSIQFENGENVKSDIFIGSDGFKSRIRKQLFPDTELTTVGEEELVGIVYLPEIEDKKDLFIKVIDSENGCSMGLIPLLNDHYIWFFQFNASIHQLSENKPEIIQQFMKDRVDNFPNEFQSAIKNTNFNQVFLWVSKRLDLLPSFHKKNMVLVGDAAHPLLAFTSQGANSAIEDALCLASLLSEQKPEEKFENVFEDYYAKRKEFIQKYINVGDELVRDFLEMKTSDEFKIPLAIH